MNDHDRIMGIIEPITLTLSLVCLVIILVGFADLGQMKTFDFVIGEGAAATAIAYSFQAARRLNKFTLSGIAIWFFIASISFANAAWPVAR